MVLGEYARAIGRCEWIRCTRGRVMKERRTIVAVALLFIAVMVAGCGEDSVDGNCGEGTVEDGDSGECVPEELECDDGQTLSPDGTQCVATADQYCGTGTELDDDSGQCVAPEFLECGEGSLDDDGECVPESIVECGEGTVAHELRCRPSSEVCGGNTIDELDDDDDAVSCRPFGDACGEGTTFDVVDQVCVRLSDLECGPGTIEAEGTCQASSSYYGDLADNADVDATGVDEVIDLDVQDVGDRSVFVGSIDAPQFDDGEPIQDEDHYRIDAEVGQWIEVSVFSMGLPEPGFEWIGESAEYERYSDLGSGVEARRTLLIPEDDSYELTVSNLPQMLGTAPPAGDADWKYVGYVEVLEAPDAQPLDIDDDIAGDIRATEHNWYSIDAPDDASSLGLLFDAVPDEMATEFQLWLTPTYLEDVMELQDVVTFDVDSDEMFVFLDYERDIGHSTDYEATLRQGGSVDAGDTFSRQISIDEGQYIGFSQNNSEELGLPASISTPGGVWNDTDELVVEDADDGQRSLYWYAADSSMTLTFEIENDTNTDIGFLTTDYRVSDAEFVDDLDREGTEFSTDENVPYGHRHYLELDVVEDFLLSAGLPFAEGRLTVHDGEQQSLGSGIGTVVQEVEEGRYILSVDAGEQLDNGFELELGETEVAEESYSSEPQVDIPDADPEGVTDSLLVEGCNVITDINMDIDIEHNWRGDLVIRLSNPEGTEHVLKARPGSGSFGDSSSDIIGNFNETLSPEAGGPATVDAEPIAEFIGAEGTGYWDLTVSDMAAGNEGTLQSWQLNVTCDA